MVKQIIVKIAMDSLCYNCNLEHKGHERISALHTYGYNEDNIIECIPSTEKKLVSLKN